MFAQEPQVRISGQPLEVAITKRKRLFQGGGGQIKFGIQRMTASQIIEHERILRFKAGELFVYFEAVGVSAALGVMVAQDLERLDVFSVAFDDPFQEADFSIEVSDLLP